VAGRLVERRRARRRTAAIVSAAAILLAALTALYLWDRGRMPGPHIPQVVYLEGTADEPAEGMLQVPGEGRLLARIGDDLVGLGPQSAVQVEQARGSVTRLRLDAGTVVADVRPRTSGRGRFEVVSGPHVISVLGTRFLVEQQGDDGLEVVVRDGVVEVRSRGSRHRVEAGYRLRVDSAGEAVLEPVEPAIERLALLLSGEARPDERTVAIIEDAEPTTPAPPTERTSQDRTASLQTSPEVSLDDLRQQLLDGDIDRTIAELEGRLAVDPEDHEAWALLAAARRKSGDREGAVEAWTEVIDRGPAPAANRARFEAAQLLQQIPGGHPRAIALFQELLASPAGVEALAAETRLHLAESLIAVGREEEARAHLEQVIHDHPGTGPALTARELLRD
jgi:TolA-binding protein